MSFIIFLSHIFFLTLFWLQLPMKWIIVISVDILVFLILTKMPPFVLNIFWILTNTFYRVSKYLCFQSVRNRQFIKYTWNIICMIILLVFLLNNQFNKLRYFDRIPNTKASPKYKIKFILYYPLHSIWIGILF